MLKRTKTRGRINLQTNISTYKIIGLDLIGSSYRYLPKNQTLVALQTQNGCIILNKSQVSQKKKNIVDQLSYYIVFCIIIILYIYYNNLRRFSMNYNNLARL